MKKLCILFGVVTSLLMLTTSCTKELWEMVDEEEKKLVGTYTVEKYRVAEYDSLGTAISSTDLTNQGSIEVKMNTDQGSDVFSHIIFKGDVSNTFIPSQLRRGYNCGYWDQAKKEFHALFQGDPDKKRILMGAICGGETITLFTDYTFTGNELKFSYITHENLTLKKTVYEYTLKKN